MRNSPVDRVVVAARFVGGDVHGGDLGAGERRALTLDGPFEGHGVLGEAPGQQQRTSATAMRDFAVSIAFDLRQRVGTVEEMAGRIGLLLGSFAASMADVMIGRATNRRHSPGG